MKTRFVLSTAILATASIAVAVAACNGSADGRQDGVAATPANPAAPAGAGGEAKTVTAGAGDSPNPSPEATGTTSDGTTAASGTGASGTGASGTAAATPEASSFRGDTAASTGAPPDGAANDGGTTSGTGLRWVDIKVGDGAQPLRGQTALVHTKAWLADGVEFENTYAKGKPLEWPVLQGSFIAGWEEGVATMRVGGKRRLTIPPELGFGRRGSDLQGVPPNAQTIFEVELVELR